MTREGKEEVKAQLGVVFLYTIQFSFLILDLFSG